MADLSKCKGEKEEWICPLREECYRYTSKEDPYMQSWLSEIPYNKEKKECPYQMYVRDKINNVPNCS